MSTGTVNLRRRLLFFAPLAGVPAAAVGMTLLFWLPLWRGGGIVGGDSLTYFFPQKVYLAEHLKKGDLPLWNNLSGHGYPVIAESQTGLCYPPTLLLYRLLDVNTAYNVNLILHYVLAFVFTWLYARQMKLKTWGAGLAAVVFTYGWFPSRFHFEWSFLTGAWLPLVFWCVERYLQRVDGRWLMVDGQNEPHSACDQPSTFNHRPSTLLLLLSIAVAMQLLAGHFALAFITQVGVAGYVLLRLWLGRVESREPRVQSQMPPRGVAPPLNEIAQPSTPHSPLAALHSPLATFLLPLAAVAFGFVLAAVQILPTWELKHQSHRAGENPFHDISYGRIPPVYLLQMAAPWHFYSQHYNINQSSPDDAPETNEVEAHLYLGLLPLLLVVAGVATGTLRQNRLLWPWLVLAIVSVIVSTGCLTPLFRLLPGFGYFGGPGRWGILTTLGGGLIAGASLDRLLAAFSRFTSRFVAGLVLAATVADLFIVSGIVTFATVLPVSLVEFRAQSILRREFARHDGLERVFGPGQNLLTMADVSVTPNFLGLAPVAYFDPALRFPGEFSFSEPPHAPQPGQVEWLQRAGVTHLLTLGRMNEQRWPVRFLGEVLDPFLNRCFSRREPFYLFELEGSRGRVAWEQPSPDATARAVEYAADRIIVEATSESGGRLVLTDLAYPGWRVTVDGTEAAPLTVDGMYRGVNLPPGEHSVVWEYRPASVQFGAIVSGVAFAALIAAGLWGWRRR